MEFEGRPRTETDIIDASVILKTGLKGVAGFIGETERGPVNTPKLVRNWDEYRKYFGELPEKWTTPKATLFPWLCKRALDGGAALVIVRVEHYTSIIDATTGTSLKPTKVVAGVTFTGTDVGDYKARVTVSNAASGAVDKFDILCELPASAVAPDVYKDIDKIVTAQIAEQFKNKIKFMEIGTGTLAIASGSTVSGDLTGGSYAFDDLVDADYIGDSISVTGIRAFDTNKQIIRIAVPHKAIGVIDNALAVYADLRKDIRALVRTPVGLNCAGILDYRNGSGSYSHTAIDTYRASMFTGGIMARNPVTNVLTEIPELADVVWIKAKKDNKFAEWFAAAGSKFPVKDAAGVAYDLSSPARADEWNDVSKAGVNAVINHLEYGVCIWDNATLQKASTMLKHENVAELMVFLFRSLKPLVESLSFDPNDVETWKAIHRIVTKFLDNLVLGRAIQADYIYQGDQDIEKISDATFNDPNDVDAGGYKFRVFVKPISALKYIGIELVVTNSNVNLKELIEG
jgi:uncharacterized protein